MADRVFELNDLQRILRAGAGGDQDFDLDEAALDEAFTDLGYDSIALLETAARITREYGVTIDDDALVDTITPRCLIELVNAS
jgi:minimal PKS acyl carrier protein